MWRDRRPRQVSGQGTKAISESGIRYSGSTGSGGGNKTKTHQRQLLSHLRQFYTEAEISRSEMESLASSAELAAESMRLTTLRYQAGESTVLEVVDAQNTLTQARNAYDDGQARFRVAMANLQTLTGTF